MIINKIFIALLCFLPSVVFAQTLGGGIVGRIGSAGSWTPAVTASGTAGTPAYTTAVGSYVKVGSFIHAQFNIVLSGWTGTPSGNVSIIGLPFTSTTATNDDGGCLITQYTVTGLAASNFGIAAVIAPNTSTALLQSEGNAGTVNVTAAQTGTTPTLIGFCNYHQ
jgi:hypothetical protein